MHLPRIALALVACVVSAVTILVPGASAQERKLPVVPRYSVYEHGIPWRSTAANPWDQVSVDVRLVSPQGKAYQIGGFYSSPGVWKFRFAPPTAGRWKWAASIVEGSRTGSLSGSFTVGKSSSPGFVRRSPYNPYRWTFSNGAPYYPIGLNDCTNVNNTRAELWGLDGGIRPDGPGHGSGRLVGITPYMRAYSAAGFDLFRWGPDNCSFALYDKIDPSGNAYSAAGTAAADRLFRTLRSYGFRIEMVLFGSSPPFASSGDPSQLAAVDRYVKYIVDRYGAYVDFWELTNEATPSDSWLTQVGTYLERIDPYGHPVGTSWSRPQLPVMQFGSDHWYQTEDPSQSDTATWSRIRGEAALSLGKPTLIDEQGNTGANWDPTSGLRLRLRSWTAFFAEGTLVFWNTSFIKNCCPGGAMSIYIGPDERRYIHVLQSFTKGFDPRAKIATAAAAPSGAVRGYALRGPRMYALYLVAANRSRPVTGVTATVDPARGGTATWIDPASGRIVKRQSVRAGSQTLAVPVFADDLALKIK